MRQDKFEPEDAQEQQEYEKELTYGINWNTNGGIIGGFDMKFAWQTKSNQLIYNLVGLEIGHVVHPKERLKGSSFGTYVEGKQSNLFVIRPHFGREWVIFRKAEEEGIQVSGILAVGPTLAYLKPYYLSYATVDTVDVNGIRALSVDFETKKFGTPLEPNQLIASSGSFLLGFNEMTASLGVHLKASLCFEYGKTSGGVGGIEVGAMFEQFTEKLIIIPEAQNQSFFGSLFVNVYFGIR